MNSEITWSEEAEARVNRAPAFLRPMVRNVTEKKAREAGITHISETFLSGVRDVTMNAGERPPTVPEPGHKAIVWTAEAEQRLAEVPLFTRDTMRTIVEEIAAERGHLEVNCKLLDQVEELGEEAQHSGPDMAWSADALEMLQSRLSETPEMAMDFMFDLYKADAEELCRKLGAEAVTVDILETVWETPHAEARWSAEARNRLDDAPDFVRSGIKKAAERRARREGLTEISSDDLTRFRNESMMKAVKRMKAFGFKELTFDAFKVAATRVKRLKDNPQAEKRFAEIQQHVEGKPDGIGLLDKQMVENMKNYLREGGGRSKK
ncbi:MAG: PCP reductase family protein [Mariprofundaceae bacterium]